MPGDPTLEETLSQMLRVNHAGEYGAGRIYAGQIAALKKSACRPTLEHMQAQEKRHLEVFEKMLTARRVRPTLLQPVWHAAGYALGYITGKMGEKAAMACTVAVEEVIDEHYHSQETFLNNVPAEQPLKAVISQFRQEELEHRDIGLAHHAEAAPFYHRLSKGIKMASRAAIWLSKRI